MAWFKADVAQTVEQLIRNEKVEGSIPFIGTKLHVGLVALSTRPFLLSGSQLAPEQSTYKSVLILKPTRPPLALPDLSRLIEMAWEDRTPFEAIEQTFGLSESGVIALMRKELKRGSFELWRKRVTGRTTKHKALRSKSVTRAYCATQYKQP